MEVHGLGAAIDRLAKLLPNGELLAATDPVQFLNSVADALQAARDHEDDLEGQLSELSERRDR